MITRVKLQLRTSKTDQENLENLKNLWQKAADIIFLPDITFCLKINIGKRHNKQIY